MNKNRLCNEKGLTLIALVITVIVLVILTSVVIRTATTDKALEQAKDTREEIIKFGEDSAKDVNNIRDMIISGEED